MTYQDKVILGDCALYLGDCLEVMKEIPDKSIDLAFVDPPYNVGKNYDGYEDNLPLSKYYLWCETWIKELKRISYEVAIYPPKNHLLWFWNQIPTNHQVICAWSPEGAIRGNFVHQYIPLLVPPKPTKRTKDHWWNVQVPGMGYYYKEEKFGNPGQTSLDITGRVISSFSKEGEIIIDCFAGVGTTGYYCAKHNRKFICIEKSKKYFEIAVKRIKDAQQQMRLPL